MLMNLFLTVYRPVYLLFLGINTAVLGITVIIASIADPTGNFVHYIGKFWSRMNLLFVGARIRVSGTEHITKGTSYLVMSNHQSQFDVWSLIGYLPLQLRWVMKKELRKVPIFGLGCERMGHIFIDRGNPEKSREELKVLKDKFSKGASVVFFPEGTRSPDGNLLPFKKGGFVMSIQTGIPILPVTVRGSRDLLPKDSTRFRPGIISIIIHEPIPVNTYSYEQKEALMEKVRHVIESGLR
ncbi:MAG TPA: lysophospholipid acyltransferase family protein [Spirochaetota bacterium]|jgi:1-acyl-sn-glycerol-3-phosphate acyltransferase|nr:lysophospholipid acyltransferase family protein [Spirochaetota bacterium]HPV40292.1 lysophospholipid acyltransferase family protein [Spirochaetota bacterium]